MCGINGILRLDESASPIDREELRRTRDAMRNRGPDGKGEWFSGDGRIALGHRRLAILDLSDASAQPMISEDGRWALVFNGEIYNYRELRDELEREGVRFRSTGDSEVLLALWIRHGPEAFPKLRGMYAFAIWDELEKKLVLARDPYGIKPLYYSSEAGAFRFASQIKALIAGGGVSTTVDREGLAGFLLWGSVPEPWTIREDVRAVPAGSWLEVKKDGHPRTTGHHRFEDTVEERCDQHPGPVEAVRDSIRSHLVSDVPVGVFLSAGLDSSLVASVAAQASADPITTFTLRFAEYRGTARDEGFLAAQVAETLGAKHFEWTVGNADFARLWAEALEAMDQPSIDGFNTFLVSRLAADHGYKVVLSGLGGDELFGSYDSFRDVPRWHRWGRRLSAVPGLRAMWPVMSRSLRPDLPKLPGLLEHSGSWAGCYYLRRGLFLPNEVSGLIDDAESLPWRALLGVDSPEAQEGDPWTRIHNLESTRYLRNQLLRDADWASMAHSLELRVPLVDAVLRDRAAVKQFARVRRLGKQGIARALCSNLPAQSWARKKTGFTLPTAQRLSGNGPTPDGLASRTMALRILDELELRCGRLEAAA